MIEEAINDFLVYITIIIGLTLFFTIVPFAWFAELVRIVIKTFKRK